MNLDQAYSQIWSRKLVGIEPPERQHINRVTWTAALFPTLPTGSLLVDFGTGSGQMLHEGRARGWNVCGYEYDPAVCKWLRGGGYPVTQADLSIDELPLNNVDVVTCCDVIEHLIDPAHAMRQAHKIMKAGGWLFVATPNMSHWRRVVSLLSGTHPRTSGDRCLWDGGHVAYFGALDLTAMLKAAGFRSVDVHFMNPDAAPVAIGQDLQRLGARKEWLDNTYQIAEARK